MLSHCPSMQASCRSRRVLSGRPAHWRQSAVRSACSRQLQRLQCPARAQTGQLPGSLCSAELLPPRRALQSLIRPLLAPPSLPCPHLKKPRPCSQVTQPGRLLEHLCSQIRHSRDLTKLRQGSRRTHSRHSRQKERLQAPRAWRDMPQTPRPWMRRAQGRLMDRLASQLRRHRASRVLHHQRSLRCCTRRSAARRTGR